MVGLSSELDRGIQQVIAEDPELRGMVRALVVDVINDVRKTMRIGTPTAKATLHKAIIPLLMKGLVEQQGDDDKQAILAKFDEMHATVRRALAPPRIPNPHPNPHPDPHPNTHPNP